jgi:hypothetical protein
MFSIYSKHYQSPGPVSAKWVQNFKNEKELIICSGTTVSVRLPEVSGTYLWCVINIS